jgi:hypothetical protein
MVVCDAVGGVFGFIVDVSNYAQITIFLIKKGVSVLKHAERLLTFSISILVPGCSYFTDMKV